jgi:hypothetical protein
VPSSVLDEADRDGIIASGILRTPPSGSIRDGYGSGGGCASDRGGLAVLMMLSCAASCRRHVGSAPFGTDVDGQER